MLPDNHNHDGTPRGGKAIRPKDLLGIDVFLQNYLNDFLPPYLLDYTDYHVFVPAGSFEDTNANVALIQKSNFAVLSFTDALTGVAAVNLMVPKRTVNITSITLLVENLSPSTNLYLSFALSRVRADVAVVNDSVSSAVYATGAVASSFTAITLPADLWSALTPLEDFDVLGLRITRTGGDALDTFGDDMNVLGVIFDFTP